jgi:hypothetical protein
MADIRAPLKYAPPHEEARREGVRDALAGTSEGEARWPAGTYGHADYWLGRADVEVWDLDEPELGL